MTMHIGKTTLDAIVVETESFVIHTKKVENGSMKVIPVHRVFGCLPTNFVCGSVGDTWLKTCASHPKRETVHVMIAPFAELIGSRLSEWSASKL